MLGSRMHFSVIKLSRSTFKRLINTSYVAPWSQYYSRISLNPTDFGYSSNYSTLSVQKRLLTTSHLSAGGKETSKPHDEIDSNLSTGEKLKVLWKKYGLLSVGTYLSMYGVTLTAMFFALKTDLLSASSFGLDPVTVISSVRLILRFH